MYLKHFLLYFIEVQGVHLLFESFVLDNGLKLFLAYIFIVAMCWTERGISFYLDYRSRRQGWKDILLRTGLYGVATTLRLWYMLITMYFNIGLFIVVVSCNHNVTMLSTKVWSRIIGGSVDKWATCS